MSAAATAWVFEKSPYSGALLVLHLAIADIVNDTYGNELWASAPTLAKKARVSERTVRSGLAQMVGDGLLVLLAAREGHVKRYRFLMPADPCTDCTPATSSPLQMAALTPAIHGQTPATDRATPATSSPNPNTSQENAIEASTLADDYDAIRFGRHPDRFAEFWSVYPLPSGEPSARKAWKRAIQHTDPQTIIDGARAYRDNPNRNPAMTARPVGWLDDCRWRDPVEAAPAPRQRPAAIQAIANVLGDAS